MQSSIIAELQRQQWQKDYDVCVQEYGPLVERLETAIQASSAHLVHAELNTLIAAIPTMNIGFLQVCDILSLVKRTKKLSFVQYRIALKLLKPIVDNYVPQQLLQPEQQDMGKRTKAVPERADGLIPSNQEESTTASIRKQRYKCSSPSPFVDSKSDEMKEQIAMSPEAPRKRHQHTIDPQRRRNDGQPPFVNKRKSGVSSTVKPKQQQLAFSSRTSKRAPHFQHHQEVSSKRQNLIYYNMQQGMALPAARRLSNKEDARGSPYQESISGIDLLSSDNNEKQSSATRKGILKYGCALECKDVSRRQGVQVKHVKFLDVNMVAIQEFYCDRPVRHQQRVVDETMSHRGKMELKPNFNSPPSMKQNISTNGMADMAEAIVREYSKLYTKLDCVIKGDEAKSTTWKTPAEYSEMWNQIAFCRNNENVIQPVLVLDPTRLCRKDVREDWQRMMERGHEPIWQVCFTIGQKINKSNKQQCGIVYRATNDLLSYDRGVAMGACQHPAVQIIVKMLIKLQG